MRARTGFRAQQVGHSMLSRSKAPKASKDPKWKIYERAAAELESAYPNCHVTLDHKVMGRRSGIERQVDVWITGFVGAHEMSIAVECKCYQGRVGIKDIEAFYSFLDDVAANKGVIISDSGFTTGASSRAHGSDMELKTMTLGQAEDFDWTSIWEKEWHEEHERHYTCKAIGCRGSISYMYDHGVKAGATVSPAGSFTSGAIAVTQCGPTIWRRPRSINSITCAARAVVGAGNVGRSGGFISNAASSRASNSAFPHLTPEFASPPLKCRTIRDKLGDFPFKATIRRHNAASSCRRFVRSRFGHKRFDVLRRGQVTIQHTENAFARCPLPVYPRIHICGRNSEVNVRKGEPEHRADDS
jgi:hypothetical protein